MEMLSDLIVGLAGLTSTVAAVAIGAVIVVTVGQVALLACRRWGFCSAG
jgi:hypothetical protein